MHLGDEPATVGEWFQKLEPLPPTALVNALTELLRGHETRPVAETPDVCMEVAEQTLGKLLASGASERTSALALLSVDALVTYAFESGSDDPARIEERTARAMSRIAMMAERSPG